MGIIYYLSIVQYLQDTGNNNDIKGVFWVRDKLPQREDYFNMCLMPMH